MPAFPCGTYMLVYVYEGYGMSIVSTFKHTNLIYLNIKWVAKTLSKFPRNHKARGIKCPLLKSPIRVNFDQNQQNGQNLGFWPFFGKKIEKVWFLGQNPIFSQNFQKKSIFGSQNSKKSAKNEKISDFLPKIGQNPKLCHFCRFWSTSTLKWGGGDLMPPPPPGAFRSRNAPGAVWVKRLILYLSQVVRKVPNFVYETTDVPRMLIWGRL